MTMQNDNEHPGGGAQRLDGGGLPTGEAAHAIPLSASSFELTFAQRRTRALVSRLALRGSASLLHRRRQNPCCGASLYRGPLQRLCSR